MFNKIVSTVSNQALYQVFSRWLLVFLFLATVMVYPFGTGDEGYHLSKAYMMFSQTQPESMSEKQLRQLEMVVTDIDRTNHPDYQQLMLFRQADVKGDGVRLNLLRDQNLILSYDILHLPAAVGVLLGRLLYPSYGVMLYAGRLGNGFFFFFAMLALLKFYRPKSWSFLLLITVPFLQKLASPSYDVLCYLVTMIYAFTLLRLYQLPQWCGRDKWQLVVVCLLVLLLKNNYLSLYVFLLPMLISRWSWLTWLSKPRYWWGLFLIATTVICWTFQISILNYLKVFFFSYLEVDEMGRRARGMFHVVPSILPAVFNLFYLAVLGLLMLGGSASKAWSVNVERFGVLTYLANFWLIYTGFYLIIRPTGVMDELSGRYLSPFLIFFLPYFENLGQSLGFHVPEVRASRWAKWTLYSLSAVYLLFAFYRGFILHTIPTWGVN